MEKQKAKSKLSKWFAGIAALGIVLGLSWYVFRGIYAEPYSGASLTPTEVASEVTPCGELQASPTIVLVNTPTLALVPTEMAEPTEEVTPEPSTEPDLTETPTEEVTPTEDITPAEEVTPTSEPTEQPTASPTSTVTPVIKMTVTPTTSPAPTQKPTQTPTPSPKPTAVPTNTPSPEPTNTPTPKPVAWEEPKERKDIAELLMAKVNDYRISQGVRKWENPYVYYDVNAPGLGDRLNAKGLRVAKKCCLEHSANHEGYQIGTGIYGYPWRVKEGWEAEDIAQQLFDAWYNSSSHNWGMLYDGGGEDEWVSVAVMHVTEHFDGEYWHYCAIMTLTFVYKEYLPEGLE